MVSSLVNPHLDRVPTSGQAGNHADQSVGRYVVGALPLLSTFSALKPISSMVAVGHQFRVLSNQQGCERYLKAAGLVGTALLSFISAPVATLVSQGAEAWSAGCTIGRNFNRGGDSPKDIKPYLDLLTALLSCVAVLAGAGLAVLLLANFVQVLKDSVGALDLMSQGATYEGIMLLLASAIRAAFTIALGRELVGNWNRPSASRGVFEELIEKKKNVPDSLNLGEELHSRGFSSAVSKQDLSNLDFSGTNLDGIRFDRCNLSNANFSRCHFTNSSFAFCRLDGASFTDTSLFDCQFRQCTGAGTRWERATLNRVTMRGSDLKKSDWSQSQVINSEWKRIDLDGSQWNQCKIRDTNLYEAEFNRSTIQNCVLKGVDLRYARMRDANVHNSKIITSDLSGIQLENSSIREVDFIGNPVYYLDLQRSELSSIRMDHCRGRLLLRDSQRDSIQILDTNYLRIDTV